MLIRGPDLVWDVLLPQGPREAACSARRAAQYRQAVPLVARLAVRQGSGRPRGSDRLERAWLPRELGAAACGTEACRDGLVREPWRVEQSAGGAESACPDVGLPLFRQLGYD
jgi:hypothetical protein